MTRIGTLEIRNPVIMASCLLGDTPENLKAAYEAGAGAVVTKSVTLEPRGGNPEPNFIKEGGGWLNCIGLRNVGAAEFARSLGKPDYPVIVSLAGTDPAGFASMIGMFECAAAFELNLSCPNVDGFGDYVGHDPALTGRVVRAAKSATNVPIFVKIAHDMVESTVAAAIDAGADGITAINSVPATAIDIMTGRSKLSSPKSGLSGPPIKSIALSAVSRLADRYDVPIMGCGGISSWEDAAEFMSAGAAAVQVGSAALPDPSILGKIAAGLSDWAPEVRGWLPASLPAQSL